jgi:hypothetical protein
MGQHEDADTLRRAEFDSCGDGIDSTRPGRHIAHLVLRLVETSESTSRSVDRLIASLDRASARSEKVSRALVWATVALVAATLASIALGFVSSSCSP